MKEQQIMFSGPMIRAILEGRKTQTRRAITKFPWKFDGDNFMRTFAHLDCPYGEPGDRLWVRENGWERPVRTPRMLREGADTWEPYYYDADGLTEADIDDFKKWGFKRRPSIHMPRWASRITLEIVSVRVQRVQGITEEDAWCEGFPDPMGKNREFADRARYWFKNLWDSINSSRGFGWEANPWVWVITFRPTRSIKSPYES